MSKFFRAIDIYHIESQEQEEQEPVSFGHVDFMIKFMEKENLSKFSPYWNIVTTYCENLECPLLYCHISMLFVDEECRGQGYGSILLNLLESYLEESAKELDSKFLFITLQDSSRDQGTNNSIYLKNHYEYKDPFHKNNLKKKIEFKDKEKIVSLKIKESKVEKILKLLKKK